MPGKDGERFALFPLNVVLLPGGLLPLRIFEPRYLRMVSECLRGTQPFVVAAIVDGPESGGAALTARTGTLARIIDWEQHADGLLGLLCEGEQAVAIGEVDLEHDQLARATVTRLPVTAPLPLPSDMNWLADLLADLLQRVGPPFDRLAMPGPSADHVAGRLIELLPLPLAEKQALFDMPDSVARLRRLAGLIDPDGTAN
jgi:Lon protease-like protein